MKILFPRLARFMGFAAAAHEVRYLPPGRPAHESRERGRPRRTRSLPAAAAVALTAVLFSLGLFPPPARAEAPAGAFAPGELLVKFRAASPERLAPAGLQQSVRRIVPGAVRKQEITRDGWQLISLPEGVSVTEAVALFTESPEVEYAEPNFRYQLGGAAHAGASASSPSNARLQAAAGETPNDPLFPRLYGLERIGAPEAWRHTTGSQSVVVAVFDTGVDYTHPELAANMWRNPGEIEGNRRDDDNNGFVDDIHGANVVSNNGDVMDPDGHGTHIAGIIGAVTGNGIGVAGVSPNVQIIAVRMARDHDGVFTGDIIRGLDYLTDLKRRGVNLVAVNHSWGGHFPSRALAEAFARLSAAGVVNVCAAANLRHDHAILPVFPGQFNLPGMIRVAATDADDHLAGFSDFGIHTVDVAAPGVFIWSTIPRNGYAATSGTSMATPHVTGAVALLYSIRPDLTPEQVKNLLMHTADPLPAFDRDRVKSGGRINVGKAARWLVDDKPLPDSFTRPEIPRLNVTSVSRTPDGFDANGPSSAPALSQDGRFVAFISTATNLVSGDSNRLQDVFLHDRASGATVRVSQTPDGLEANGPSASPVISGNGDWIAFTSNARSLVDKGNAAQHDVLLWSRLTGEIEWISRPETESPGGPSLHPGIDFSGRWVIFQSARALLEGDDNNQTDIYLRDRQTGALLLVSAAPDGRPGNSASTAPVISADGQWAAFVSQANNLVPGLAPPAAAVFARNLMTGVTELASVDGTGNPAAQPSSRPRISADGRFVAFQTAANLDGISSPAGQHIYLRDRSSGRTLRVSKASDGSPLGGNSVLEGMSGDGRWVIFRSSSQLLPPGTGSIAARLFAYDRLADDVVALSYSDAGDPSNFVPSWIASDSTGVSDGAISGDGFHVAYSTVAWNPSPGDGNKLADVFVYDRGSNSFDLTVRPEETSQQTGRGLIGANLQQYATRALKEGENGARFEISLINRGGASEGPLVWVELGAAAASIEWPQGTSAAGTDIWKLPALGAGEALVWSVYLPAPASSSLAMVRLAAGSLDAEGAFVVSDRITVSATVPLKPGGTELVSVAADGSPIDRHARRPSVSNDGRFVVFDSFSDKVIPADRNERLDVFLRDRWSRTNMAVSAAATLGNDWSYGAQISADGRFAVFNSYASNLGSDANFTCDVFLKNLGTGAIDVASRRGGVSGNYGSGMYDDSSISADGRWIVFFSHATNLVPGDTNRVGDIFRAERGTGQVELISRSSNGDLGNGKSHAPVQSSNGQWVGYSSHADNLTDIPDHNRFADAFLWDSATGMTELLSVGTSGEAALGQSYVNSISDDGRWVVLFSDAPDLPGVTEVRSGLYLLDRAAQRFHPAEDWLPNRWETGLRITAFTITANGEWLVLGTRRAVGTGESQQLETALELVHRHTGQRELMAKGLRGPGAPNDGFQEVRLQPKSFWNLAPEAGASPDGRFILFHGEGREGRQFISQAYLYERLDQTIPGSSLRISQITLLEGNQILIRAAAAPGPVYTLEHSENVQGPFIPFSSGGTIQDGTVEFRDASPAGMQRFYRIRADVP